MVAWCGGWGETGMMSWQGCEVRLKGGGVKGGYDGVLLARRRRVVRGDGIGMGGGVTKIVNPLFDLLGIG